MHIRVAAVTALLWSYPAIGDDIRMTGIFSNMRYVAQAGDVVGTEVFIVSSGAGFHASVQCAGGSPSVPVIVPVTVAGRDVSFVVPDQPQSECAGSSFKGRVTKTSLSGTWTFEKISRPEKLARKRSHWQ